jgi:hypothetical protein
MHNRMVENSVKKQALAKLMELRNEFKAASDRSKMQKRVVENLERIEVSWANECARTTRLSRQKERS